MNVPAARVPEVTAPAVVTFPAEVDLSNAGEIQAEALRLVRTGASGLIFDLTGCAFCDSAGPNLIFRILARADEAGIPLVVVLPERGVVRRICDVAAVTRDVPLAPDLRSARDRLRPPG